MLSTGKPHTDIQSETWFDALLPASARPYTRLARLDRPIGAWLLFIPGLWSIWIAGGAGEFDANGVAILPTLLWLTLLFLVGAIVMRAAGCVVNDLWDEDLDRQVSRTAGRPLASGTTKASCVDLSGLPAAHRSRDCFDDEASRVLAGPFKPRFCRSLPSRKARHPLAASDARLDL